MERIKELRQKLVVLLALLFLFFMYNVPPAQAAALTSAKDTLTRLKVSELANHTIQFTTPTGVANGETIIITFGDGGGTGYIGQALIDYTDVDVSDDTVDVALAAVPAGATWGAAFSGANLNVLTLTNGNSAVVAGSVIAIEIGSNATTGTTGDQQLANPSSTAFAQRVLSITGTFTDTGTIDIGIMTDDQVVITATVDASITFSLSANATAFGVLSTGAVTNSGTDITITAATNGSGYVVTVRDAGDTANPGLYNSIASYLIGSAKNPGFDNGPLTLGVGDEGYGIYVLSSTGTPTIAARYNNGTGTQIGGLELIDTTIISHSGTMTANDTATIRHGARIAGFTRAGSYTDTLTYIATATY